MITHAILEISDFKQVERADILRWMDMLLMGISSTATTMNSRLGQRVRALKKFPVLQIKIYVAATKTEALLK